MPVRHLLGLALLAQTSITGSLFASGDAAAARAQRDLAAIGLTSDQRLIAFETGSPAAAGVLGAIAGLAVDSRIVGIDFRPADNQLYALGDRGGIYTLDLDDAHATLRSRLDVALSGAEVGVDFNPTVDRLRIVSDTGQNLRANVDTGVTATDTTLTALGIGDAAYTNNDADPATATTLFDIDAILDQVSIQSPPNAGQLAATGKLGVDAGAAVGFDIYSVLRGGTAVASRAFASLVVDGRARLYEIDLLTGAAWRRGVFRSRDQVVDVAIPHGQR